MDIITGMDFISDVKFQLNVITESYNKIAALRIQEINRNSVIKELKHTMFIVQRIQLKLKYYEHTSTESSNLVTISQASLLLEKHNEVNRLTKIYRAVRILRNERSRFGKDLSCEDCRWTDRYLELCRNRGLNLVQRKYAAQLLFKIAETTSVCRLLTIKETSWANTNFSDPTNFTLKDMNELDANCVEMKLKYILNSNQPQGKELFKKLINLRDTFSKLLGFENYIDFSLQSQLFTDEKVNILLFTIANLTLPKWIQRVTKCLQKKKDLAKINRIPVEKDFTYKDITYYHRLIPAIEHKRMNHFFPFNKTLKNLLDLIGDYFGLAFSLQESDENLRVFRVCDADTSNVMGTVVLDLFANFTKPALKTTVAFHEAEKGFCSDFLANVDDELKFDSRFKEFQSDRYSPLMCFIVTDIREKYVGLKYNGNEDCFSCLALSNIYQSSTLCNKCIDIKQIQRDCEVMLTLFDVLHICHELSYVLWHIFGQASTQIFRTCCSEKDFLDIPSAILQSLILQPKNLQRISSSDYTNKAMSVQQAKYIVAWYDWEEPYKMMSLILNGYLDHFTHAAHMDPDCIIGAFFIDYLLIEKDPIFLCPDLWLSLTEQKAGHLYSKAWGYHVGRLIFDATFKARDFDKQVGRDFRRYFLEPDINVDFYVRLRNFLGEDPNTKSSLEKDNMWL